MVPTGRLELPRIAPLAPQASVSTNSTTSATCKKFRLCFRAAFLGFLWPRLRRRGRLRQRILVDRRRGWRRSRRGRRRRLLDLVEQRRRLRLGVLLEQIREAQTVEHEDR